MNVRVIRVLLAALAVAGCLATQALAGNPRPAAFVGDVRLTDGALVGQVVNADNAPMKGVDVRLTNGKQALASAKTNKDGYFAFRGLKNGVYQIGVNDDQMAYRVWTSETAPPSAHAGALITLNQDVVRGQAQGGFLRRALSNPLVVGGLVATAIAVPIAVHNADDDEPSTP